MVRDFPLKRGKAGGNAQPSPHPEREATTEPPKKNNFYALKGREEEEKPVDMVNDCCKFLIFFLCFT